MFIVVSPIVIYMPPTIAHITVYNNVFITIVVQIREYAFTLSQFMMYAYFYLSLYQLVSVIYLRSQSWLFGGRTCQRSNAWRSAYPKKLVISHVSTASVFRTTRFNKKKLYRCFICCPVLQHKLCLVSNIVLCINVRFFYLL